MRILAINTATEFLSVALKNDDKRYLSFDKRLFNSCSQSILLLIKEVLDQSGLSLKKLDAIAFSHGPGSFTGVRVGIGVAKGLAIGIDIPLIGISTLVTLAQGAWCNTGAMKVLTAINARMGEVYWAEYVRENCGTWHGKKTETILKTEMIRKRLERLSEKHSIAGTGWKTYPEMIRKYSSILQDSRISFPFAKDMLPIAVQFLSIGKTVSAEKAEPIYFQNETSWKKFQKD